MAQAPTTSAQDKLRFTVQQLADTYKSTPKTVRKMLGDTPPVGKKGNGSVWHLYDVTTLNDVRTPYIPPEPEEETIETDPDKMKPSDRRTHYQAEDLKQSSEMKARKNDLEAGEVIASYEVQQCLAEAFKKVALTLDTLPDALERDGYIGSTDIEGVISILDSSREQLAQDLSSLSPIVQEINDEGEW